MSARSSVGRARCLDWPIISQKPSGTIMWLWTKQWYKLLLTNITSVLPVGVVMLEKQIEPVFLFLVHETLKNSDELILWSYIKKVPFACFVHLHTPHARVPPFTSALFKSPIQPHMFREEPLSHVTALSSSVCCWGRYEAQKSKMTFRSHLQRRNKKKWKWDRKGKARLEQLVRKQAEREAWDNGCATSESRCYPIRKTARKLWSPHNSQLNERFVSWNWPVNTRQPTSTRCHVHCHVHACVTATELSAK